MSVNVLVVDDSGVMRAMILKSLRMSGISLGETHEAGDGRQGLEVLAKENIDLVIVDINMPVMNGEEMIDNMQHDPKMKDVPIVVISTEGSELRQKRLKEKGALFIQKPFAPKTIRDMLKGIIKPGDINEGTN